MHISRILFLTIFAFLAERTMARTAGEVHAALVKELPGLRPDQVWQSQIPGLFEIRIDGGSAFVTDDARYLIRGDLFEITGRKNLSDERRASERRDALAKIDMTQAIVFAPPAPRHTITVFTDVDCGYCRKLHSQVADFNEAGIAVRYLAFPRTGPNTQSWNTMEAVWCSENPRDALTRAKKGEAIPRPAGCATQAIQRDYQLGEQIGLQGTPLIILEDGRSIGGYISPSALLKTLASVPTVATR